MGVIEHIYTLYLADGEKCKVFTGKTASEARTKMNEYLKLHPRKTFDFQYREVDNEGNPGAWQSHR
jgi:hypothetical protein